MGWSIEEARGPAAGRQGYRLKTLGNGSDPGRRSPLGLHTMRAFSTAQFGMSPNSDDDSRFAVCPRPVNRRTAARVAGVAHEDDSAARRRGEQLQKRHAAGASLRGLAKRPQPTAALRQRTLVLALAGTGALTSTLFAPVWLALPAAGLLFGAAWWSARGRAAQDPAPAVDAADLRALDALIESSLPQLSETLQQDLRVLKQGLGQALASGADDPQDRLYLRECVRRYLPDSLKAYILVPAPRRAQPLGASALSADEALRQQFALMQSKLDAFSARQETLAGEALLRQQRFLEAKSRDAG